MYVGFDIGGTTIKYGVLDETGAILEKIRFRQTTIPSLSIKI